MTQLYRKLTVLIVFSLFAGVSIAAAQQQPPPRRPGGGPGGGGRNAIELDDSVLQVDLDVADVVTYGDALSDQVALGDGAGIDGVFRNSGVVIDEENGLYYAVNGVHPVNQGDYTSYYPKSIVAASLETDEIVQVYSFSEVNGHDVDMEALAFAEDTDTLYVGDEYNYIYELDLETGDITREWDLADIGVETGADRGIESLTYASETGYFYAGIQDSGEVYILDLNLEADTTDITMIDTFDAIGSPSGLYVHTDGQIYMTLIGGDQYIFRFDLEGELNCAITIPADLNMARPDGIWITSDDAYVYLVDSQGPLFDGYSLYQVGWTDPCNVG